MFRRNSQLNFQKKTRTQSSGGKLLATIYFWDMKNVLLIEYMAKSSAIRDLQ